MSNYQPVIGLEIHSELKTQSKMFCDCLNQSGIKGPNVNICPICLGHPGTLPAINRTAVELVVKAGLALNCAIAKSAKFDRKNYFYPDLPKGYQISQYNLPLALGGWLDINGKKIRLTRIHLEEDAGKLIHPKGTSPKNARHSLVDFNRAGVPLMELVTEPDISSGEEAGKFCEELQLILRYLEISEANMEKGQMRCEVNISLRPAEEKKKLGTKVEIKNLNSFRAVRRAIEYEIKRQSDLLESVHKVVHETRGWDEDKQKTFSQRSKEQAQDYRYFPEPDLPPLGNLVEMSGELAKEIPELPLAKRERFVEEYKLPVNDIATLTANKGLADYFEQVVSELDTWLKIKSIKDKDKLVKLTANYLLTELQKLMLSRKTGINKCQISPENFAEFITMIERKEISSSAAQAVLKEMFDTGADPSHVVEEKQLTQVSGRDELSKIVKRVVGENQKSVNDYKAGKGNALQYLVGQTMKASQGKANPEVVREILMEMLR
ncbi:MAG: Asp-tRNA(Asn)/Glu-tRNA(Gln) amidotransferase subunit GatB [Candidatus Portnoybacteria bacterium CG_4_8_14_3_um_filter_44_15]|uniref:Aspartyl/glutamyl-tRNA(Asn/Gln) amidotransferase subunit B n=4 Tax=Candidatus Portnoyibacteriota TaxID=1817913 RepID=A0A2M7YME8_9BACT|nr:MAG: glutaminyl-tRNA synthase (glutamine-hydrolyzing) subunit B [Parcubacteria group bacterium CG1_02_44_65]PIW74917.1 MAG: Asp-tRNA(Asn)/Glu-tRNA(Gln) amidotransferase subunit GatB [Candidatus Portnoybacteria bacterium CG_4_8_14_3_um_filter_44_15]PJA64137.1 MAG: Asp-tRNA(Asn)/Glu-tRNA(Gln) amidotransferase subunit GatB [Candidatus Portnoybacteria bacterium CG_4_9_14_3_um_filter_43_11]PJE59404.1 MAG: Asp-tRNA(Asn)/Glu-tRNA(Gln) amidotransferase subunit GatB [Candidatus Portnoybacteria bacteri